MTEDAVINKVREIMNEAGNEENLSLLSEDTVKLSEYIKSVIPEAVNLVMLSTPVQFLNTTPSTVSVSNQNGIGILNLPSDFFRLAAIKLKEWKRAVFMVHPLGSEEYKIQNNPITRSGNCKPVCILSYSISSPIIECYPSGTLEYFQYVKVYSSSMGLASVKDVLFASVCYMCASLVYYIFEMPQTGDKMKSIAVELIPKE